MAPTSSAAAAADRRVSSPPPARRGQPELCGWSVASSPDAARPRRSIAPFAERRQRGAPSAAGDGSKQAAPKPHTAAAAPGSAPPAPRVAVRHAAAARQPAAALQAAAKVAAAEAAVSAAAVALTPAGAAGVSISRGRKAGSRRAATARGEQPQQALQQPQRASQQQQGLDAAAAAARDASSWPDARAPGPLAGCLHVRGGASPAPSLPRAPVPFSCDAAAGTGGEQGRQQQQWLQQDWDLAAQLQQGTVQLSAAALLAVRGITKRLRAQLHSAHGPPPFRRSAPPRPPSPPPLVLDGRLLLEHCPGAAAPSDVQAADLSCLGISSAAGPAADAPVQLQAFDALCSLDVSGNRLACIAGLAVLPALQHLAASANRLRSLQHLAPALGLQPCSTHGSRCSSSTSGGPGPPVAADDGDSRSGCSSCGGGSSCGSAAPDAPCWSLPADGVSGFRALEVLDLSFNCCDGEQLLGLTSPLGFLPRLRELHAAGNDVACLPTQLGPFAGLTHLDLQRNQLLTATALLPLQQLPALQLLDVAHNPIASRSKGSTGASYRGSGGAASDGSGDSSGGGTGGCAVAINHSSEVLQQAGTPSSGFAALHELDVSSSRVSTVQQLLPLLAHAPLLAVLRLAGTPLAQRCQAGNALPPGLASRPGLSVVLGHSDDGGSASHRSRWPRAGNCSTAARPPLVHVPEAASPQHVLAAASKAALVALPHQLLVAAFERVAEGIDRWQQLPPVPEEEDSAAAEPRSEPLGWPSQEAAAGLSGQEAAQQPHEPDKTFLTGVGITAQLPSCEDAGPSAATELCDTCAAAGAPPEDPTERLARLLGLRVEQLAHHTGRTPVGAEAAVLRLRHALAFPLVDVAAGERPPQHHAATTIAASAKQRPRQAPALAQPIGAELETRLQQAQGLDGALADMRGRLARLQGGLLQQLSAQAQQLCAVGARACAAGPGAAAAGERA